METYLDRRVELINELSRGKELALQLHAQLTRRFDHNGKNSSSTSITQATMLDEIFSCYNNVLSIIDHEDQQETSPRLRRGRYNTGAVADGGGGGVDGFGGEWSTEKHDQMDGRPYTKRKKRMLPRWSERVKIEAGTSLDGAHSDGHSWRKYGQKKILGTAHPRNYYRCTHRHTQDCLATKQVQKSDTDPTLVHVIYQGHHTCHHHHPVNFTTNINTLQPTNNSDPAHILEPAPPPSPPTQNSQPASSPTHLSDPRQHHHAEPVPAGPAAILDSSADQGKFFFRSFSFSSSAFLEPDTDLLTNGFFSAPPPAEAATAAVLGSPSWLSVPARSVSGCSVASNPESDLNEALSTANRNVAAAVLVTKDLPGEGDGFGFMTLDELGISNDVEFEFDNIEA